MIIPLFFGSRSRSIELEEEPSMPNNVLCYICGKITRPKYRKKQYHFCLCFLNTFMINESSPYLACSHCNANFGNFGTCLCNRCKTAYPEQFSYCPKCGMREQI